MNVDCLEFPAVVQGDTPTLKMNWAPELASGVTITGASISMVGTGSTDVTFGTIHVSTESLIISNSTATAGQALWFSVTGFSAQNEYRVRAKATFTDSQIVTRFARFRCVASS